MRRTWVRRVGAAVALASVLTVAVASVVPAVAAAGTDPTSAPTCGRDEQGEPKRCVGPVTDESGGGGGTVTIVVSIVVGLTVAGVAFVLVRRQLAPPVEQGDAR